MITVPLFMSILDWTNFPLWKVEIQLGLLILNCDHVIREHAPAIQIAEGDYDITFTRGLKNLRMTSLMGALKKVIAHDYEEVH